MDRTREDRGETARAAAASAAERRAALAAVAIAAVAAAAVVVFLWGRELSDLRMGQDGEGYVSVTRYLLGEIERDSVNVLRASRPLVPVLALPFAALVGAVDGFLLTNAALFVVLVAVWFRLARALLGGPREALLAALLLICAFPIYYRGINVTVDLVSWLIFASVAAAIHALTGAGRFTRRAAIAMSAACGLGTLATELVLASMLLVAIEYVLTHRGERSAGALLADLASMGLAFGAPVLLFQIAYAAAFDFSLLDNLHRKWESARKVPYALGPLGTLRTLAATFGAALLLLPFGCARLGRDPRAARLLASMGAAGLATLLATYVASVRFAFVLFPVVFTLCVCGADRVARATGAGRWLQTLLVAGVCASNLGLYAAFVHFETTDALARHFVPFLVD